MASTFGTVFRATRPGQSLSALHGHAATLRDAVRDSGAIFLRGFEFGLADFEAFCALFSGQAVVHPGTRLGGRSRVSDTTATVDSGTLPFPWHAELGYAPQRPDLVAFTCEQAPQRGGETLLTDGCAIADRLSATGAAVAKQRVTYRYGRPEPTWPVAFDGARSPAEVEHSLADKASRLGADEGLDWSFPRRGTPAVRIRFTTPMLTTTRWGDRRAFCNHVIWQERRRRDHGPHPLDLRRFLRPRDGVRLEDGSRIPAEAFGEFERLADDLSYAIEWRRGDVALLDNSRVMHARGEVLDPARRILARMCNAAF
jgi:alpha-ketoglutarate-dependent taurine dioxygenase